MIEVSEYIRDEELGVQVNCADMILCKYAREIVRLRNKLDVASDIIFSHEIAESEVEHQIWGHADDLPFYLRRAAKMLRDVEEVIQFRPEIG